MGKTKKVRSAGRFGSRYGIGIRKRLLKIEDKQKEQQPCPRCGFLKVKRISKGVFVCKKCNAKFAGGAYLPTTLTGRLINKMVVQKSFTAAELGALKEKAIEKPVEEGKESRAEGPGEKKKKKRGRKNAERAEAEGEGIGEIGDSPDDSEAQ